VVRENDDKRASLQQHCVNNRYRSQIVRLFAANDSLEGGKGW